MFKGKSYNTRSIFLVVGLAVIVFIYNDFLCSSSNCYELEGAIFEPLFWGLLGIIPALSLLLFFPEQIFISWIRHIAWWVVLMGSWAVTNNENENDLSPFADDTTIIGVLAIFLFVVTLIYALIMNRRLKKGV
jgi:hypothetical protein